jgi:hypothetical protein
MQAQEALKLALGSLSGLILAIFSVVCKNNNNSEIALKWKFRRVRVDPGRVYRGIVFWNWVLCGILLTMVEFSIDAEKFDVDFAVAFYVSQFLVWSIVLARIQKLLWKLGIALIPCIISETYIVYQGVLVYSIIGGCCVALKIILCVVPFMLHKSRVVSMEIPLNDRNQYQKHFEKECGFDQANWLSKVGFLWVDRLIELTSSVVNIDYDDIDLLPAKDRLNLIYEQFYREWDRNPISERSLLKSLFAAFGRRYMMMGGLKFVVDFLNFSGPVLLELIVGFLSSERKSDPIGYLWVGLLFLSILSSSILQAQYDFYVGRVGLWVIHF